MRLPAIFFRLMPFPRDGVIRKTPPNAGNASCFSPRHSPIARDTACVVAPATTCKRPPWQRKAQVPRRNSQRAPVPADINCRANSSRRLTGGIATPCRCRKCRNKFLTLDTERPRRHARSSVADRSPASAAELAAQTAMQKALYDRVNTAWNGYQQVTTMRAAVTLEPWVRIKADQDNTIELAAGIRVRRA